VVALCAWYRRGGQAALALPIALLVTAAWQLFIWYGDFSRDRWSRLAALALSRDGPGACGQHVSSGWSPAASATTGGSRLITSPCS
jgi:hypothetical protein